MTIGRTEILLRRTRRRLFAVTLVLLILLVVGVGTATALIGLSSLDTDVDQALQTAVQSQLTALNGELPNREEEREAVENPLGGANTVLLVLDPSGRVLLNRTGQLLAGMPVTSALAAAAVGPDLRTITTRGIAVRVLTVPVIQDGVVAAYIQGGFDMTLHDQQSQSLVLAVVIVGAMGLVAAALITLLVTGRALAPIQDSFEAQRRFVADASHELRTPAALIRANAEVIEREGLVGEDGRPLLEDVIAEADRLGGLVGDLLQLAAWDEMQLSIEPAPLDAAALASDTVRAAAALAAERGVALEVDAPEPAVARADRDRLTQLLVILLDNAVDHSPAGGVVTVRVRRAAHTVTVDVDDQGPGIAEEDRERIFEPFTRLTGTTRHGSGGTGLGLAIARRIMDAHGGSIRAGSLEVGGARFTVELPAGTPPSAADTATSRMATDPSGADEETHRSATRSAQGRGGG